MTLLRRSSAAAVVLVVALLLAGCGALGPASLTALPRTVQQGFADQGAPARIAEVRRFTVAALSAEVNTYRSTDAAGGLAPAERVREASAFESRSLAEQLRAGPPLGMPIPFDEAAFVPVRWEGVTVRDDRAKVYVIGHQEYRTPQDGLARGPAMQVQLLLRREASAPRGWLVIAVAAVSDERVASIDPSGRSPDR